MQNKTFRTGILFLFIVLNIYCYGARIMDYFTIYESWKLIDQKFLAALLHNQVQIMYWLLSSRFIM